MPGIAILLAAGRSVRMQGADKRWLAVEGVPMALRAARAIEAAPVSRRLAVMRPTDTELAGRLAERGFECVVNPVPDRGRASSLACAWAALPQAAPVLIALADLPELTGTLVCELWQRFCAMDERAILIPRYQGQWGHPRCLGADHVAALRAQAGADSVPAYLARHPEATRFWDVDDPAVVRDIDTPADYAALCRRLASNA
ncbi:MAG TPA: nucleotidyltransferase family protein [Candidatus Macondimonas sp.]|nr:nucleotidyltransferase family protein [Candidatus Macondimonas sp.]